MLSAVEIILMIRLKLEEIELIVVEQLRLRLREVAIVSSSILSLSLVLGLTHLRLGRVIVVIVTIGHG